VPLNFLSHLHPTTFLSDQDPERQWEVVGHPPRHLFLGSVVISAQPASKEHRAKAREGAPRPIPRRLDPITRLILIPGLVKEGFHFAPRPIPQVARRLCPPSATSAAGARTTWRPCGPQGWSPASSLFSPNPEAPVWGPHIGTKKY